MLDDIRAGEIEAHDVIGQFGAEAGRDRFGDFHRGERNSAAAERMLGQR